MKELAPIVLFVYNRPRHTAQTLEALMQNDLADQSVLYIYADGPKENASQEDIDKIQQTRSTIRAKQWCKHIHYIESDVNRGLANSVIKGVTEIINQHGKVIVLEDDLLCAKGFLKFMNSALKVFSEEERVWQISGYFFPVRNIKYRNSSFFLSFASSWGWATWKRAWKNFDPLAEGYEELKTDKHLSYRFDINGSYPYTTMLMNQMDCKNINSWAIRWWWSIFKNEALTLFPDKSLVRNIGYGQEGTHTVYNEEYMSPNLDANYQIKNFPDKIVADINVLMKLQAYLQKGEMLKSKLRLYLQGKMKRILQLFR